MDVGPRTVDEVEFSGAEDLVTTSDGTMFKVELFFPIPVDQCFDEVLHVIVVIHELLPTRSFRGRQQHRDRIASRSNFISAVIENLHSLFVCLL